MCGLSCVHNISVLFKPDLAIPPEAGAVLLTVELRTLTPAFEMITILVSTLDGLLTGAVPADPVIEFLFLMTFYCIKGYTG